MKAYLLLLSAVILLVSCKPVASFETPNDLDNISGTLYLENGEQLEGKLFVDDGWNGTVKIHVPGEKKTRRYRFDDVKAYQLRSDYYELKEIRDGTSIGRNNRLHFMKRLTPDNSKIHLYELLEKETSYSNYQGYRRNRPTTSIEREYFIQLPNEKGDGVWNVGFSRLVPNFDEKVSTIVSDCPSLSRKIANKEKGYFYPQVGPNDEERADILWKIIEEYNKCR